MSYESIVHKSQNTHATLLSWDRTRNRPVWRQWKFRAPSDLLRFRWHISRSCRSVRELCNNWLVAGESPRYQWYSSIVRQLISIRPRASLQFHRSTTSSLVNFGEGSVHWMPCQSGSVFCLMLKRAFSSNISHGSEFASRFVWLLANRFIWFLSVEIDEFCWSLVVLFQVISVNVILISTLSWRFRAEHEIWSKLTTIFKSSSAAIDLFTYLLLSSWISIPVPTVSGRHY